MLEIDGSIGEGGGQVLRTALSLSCVLSKPVRVRNIRAGREQPGLKPQHLSVCNMLSQLSGAKMEGATLGSCEVVFEPGKMAGGRHEFDIGTAGSCTLFLQAALPALISAGEPCDIRIRGGTHVRGAPTFEYFSEVFLPAARKFGVNASAKMVRSGFYPKGGGEIALETSPSELRGAEFLAGDGKKAHYEIVSSGIPPHVPEREKSVLLELLFGFRLAGKASSVEAACPGNALTLWSGSVGACSLGERGKKAEDVAREACETFLAECASGSSVDTHLADQLLIYAALSGGKSKYKSSRQSSHLKTNAVVIQRMTGRNIILGEDGCVEVI